MISTLINWTHIYIIYPEQMVPNEQIATNILDSTKSEYLSICANIITDKQKIITISYYRASTYSIRVSYNIPYIGGYSLCSSQSFASPVVLKRYICTILLARTVSKNLDSTLISSEIATHIFIFINFKNCLDI